MSSFCCINLIDSKVTADFENYNNLAKEIIAYALKNNIAAFFNSYDYWQDLILKADMKAFFLLSDSFLYKSCELLDNTCFIDIIENNSDFNVEKDLTKGSKREDTLAYQISISVDLLNDIIKENYELDKLYEEELFDEYMTLSDELAMELEEYMPEDVIINARAYKWDNSDNTIKLVLAMAHLELGELKLSDITRRLLTQVD